MLTGRVAFLGIGNTDRADDGAGVVLARLLMQRGVKNVFEDGPTPERLIPRLRDQEYDTIVFLDAVEAGSEPGSAVILDAQRMKSAFPQISTHKLALSTLASLVAEGSTADVWLLGI
jgi:hydrogenase maturation protease